MKDHPIPQDVTGYKFHIVGNMTLKQFGIIVFGVIVAFIIYQLKLPALVAWPFIILFGGGGLLAAFVPIEERPLDHWILTFIRALYRPTQFFWQRKPHVPEVFNYQPNLVQAAPPPADLAPAKRARIHDYLNSLHNVDMGNEPDENSQQIAQIMTHFSSNSVPATPTHSPAPAPSMTVKIRPLAPDPETDTVVVTPSIQPVDIILPPSPQTPTVSPPIIAADPQISVTPPANVAPNVIIPPEVPSVPTPMPIPTPVPSPTRTILQAAGAIQVPSQTTVEMDHKDDSSQQSPSINSWSNPASPLDNSVSSDNSSINLPDTTPSNPISPNTTSSVTPKQPSSNTQIAQQPGNLPFPSPPSEPNLVVGMVVNAKEELLPGAIVEVATASGQVVRVVRTNALGQFFVTTPLPNGSYILQAEQDGLSFTPQQLEISNTPVAPLLFRAAG